MLAPRVAFVDLETTGANAAHERITEIGIVRVDEGRVVDEWSSLVNPDLAIPPFIESITGISDAMVRDAPRFAELADEVAARLEGRLFVAHNARFDYGFLRREFLRLGRSFDQDVLCTVKLSRRLWPAQRSHSLDAIIGRHRIECAARHRALGDAQVLWQFVQAAASLFPAATLAEAVAGLTQHAAPVLSIARELIDQVPESPGIYHFHGEDGALLHLGRAGNLRARVLAHLTGAHPSNRDARLAKLARNVSWTETAGPIGAQLEEWRYRDQQECAAWMRARGDRSAWFARWVPMAPDAAGRLELVEGHVDDSAELFGPFASSRDAQAVLRGLAACHSLCLILAGIEQSEGPCSAHAIGRCAGVCTGLELAVRHDARLLAAIAPLRLQPWPYRGAVGIRETNVQAGRSDVHVVRQWRHLGSARSEADLHDLRETRGDAPFRTDCYRLFTRILHGDGPPVEVIELE